MQQGVAKDFRRFGKLRVPVERDHGFRWKMITQSGGR
jgi:ribosomal protein L34